jgi:anthranilate synthase/aminodeoxychorismate synthase-like glutamine amidotransferase
VILLLDNYDSFTFNLAQAFWELGATLTVVRNDAIDLQRIDELSPRALVISPGPGRPADAGVSCAAIARWSGRIPILGVCLGHQAIGEVFGATLDLAKRVRHGKSSPMRHSGDGVFSGLPEHVEVGRYHSLSLRRELLPASLETTATSVDDDEVMGIRHKEHPTFGVQFHPESVLTPDGPKMIASFLRMVS